ncbi:MAG: hypothetical protein KF723_01965 [Rhizobiaceae bacterium]|nr:hypothetical protein [Rhizobiaceae bacterium]
MGLAEDSSNSSSADTSGRRLPRILVPFPTIAYFGAILRNAKVLKDNGIAEVFIYAHTAFQGIQAMRQQAREAGIHLICAMKDDRSGYNDLEQEIEALGVPLVYENRRVATAEMLRREGSRSVRVRLALVRLFGGRSWRTKEKEQYLYWRRLNATLLNRVDRVIDRLGIDVFICHNEVIEYNSQYFVASMKAIGKRTVYLPFSVPSFNEMDGWFSSNLEYGALTNASQRAFALLFPGWVRRLSGKLILRIPLGRAMNMVSDQLAPKYPWRSFTGKSDIACLNSPFLAERFVEMGASYRMNRTFVIGASEDDEMMQAGRNPGLRDELAAQFGWTDNKPIALFSPSTDMTDQYALPEFASYGELLEYWLRSLSKLTRFHVVVSPHPWFLIAEEPRRIFEKAGANIAWRKVAELLPASDLFITFGASSTPRLAATAGLPVLNYLCFDAKFRPEDRPSYFVGFDSMPTAASKREWEALLEKVNDPAYFSVLKDYARRDASYFGVQAGSYAERMRVLINSLVAHKGDIGDAEFKAIRDAISSAGRVSS